MFRSTNAGLGLLILRVVIGLVFLLHGIAKLTHMDGTIAFFTQVGIPMPHVAAWVVGLVETAGGAALILGVAVPVVALLLAIDMAVAILKVVLRKGFVGGYEFELSLLAALVCLMLSGPGIMAVQLRAKQG
jgi:putative oxidoreductase